MITLKELIKDTDFNKLSSDIQNNLDDLLPKLNKIRLAYNKPMMCSSGFRTMEHHIEIYKKIAERNKKIFDISKVPMQSKHLFGQAADFADNKKELQEWVLKNQPFVEDVGLWCEDFNYTKLPNSWVHFQAVPYKSWVKGKSIFFIPF